MSFALFARRRLGDATKFIRLASVAAALCAANEAAASSAALIDADNRQLRQDIQWLIDRGIIEFSASTWPVSIDALEFAIAHKFPVELTRADHEALRSVQRLLQLEREAFGVELGTVSRAHPALADGEDARSRGRLGVYARGEMGNLAGRLQANGMADPSGAAHSNTNLEGSYVSGAFLGQIVYAGQLARWWGPGQDQSLIWSDSAEAIATVGLRRGRETAPDSPWLSWIGPWGYDLSVGTLRHYRSNPGTRILGMRLYARPMRGLEIGASRFIQWGGGDGGGLASLGDALVGRANSPDRPANNEIAGFDLRYGMAFGDSAMAFYGQAVGEDEAGSWPAKYIGLLGAEYRHGWSSARLHWYVEAADTKVNRAFRAGARGEPHVAYEHSFFRDGLRHDGLPIGAWIDGDARMYSAGLNVAAGGALDFRYGFRVFHVAADAGAGWRGARVHAPGSFQGGRMAISWRYGKTDLGVAMSALGGRGRPYDVGAGLFVKTRF